MLVRKTIAVAVCAGVLASTGPALAQAIRESEVARSGDWRIVRGVDAQGVARCSARRTGPAGDIVVTRLGARAWTISVPGDGRTGKIVASIGPEDVTLDSDGRRAWLKLRETPSWGGVDDPGPYTVTLADGQPMEWEMKGVEAALKLVERCGTAGSRPSPAMP